MKGTATTLQMIVRISGLILIVLGILFWVGSAQALIPIHMLLGLLLVLALWALAVAGMRSGTPAGLTGLAIVWGVIVVALGVTQAQIAPGGAHWIVQVVHLLVGIVAIGLSEMI